MGKDEFSNETLERYKQFLDSGYNNPKLKQLYIELTIRCNENCRHCGSRCGDTKEIGLISNSEIMDSLSKLRDDLINVGGNLPYIIVTGGEPLLRKDFIELMRDVHKLGYNWGMTTNASLITPKLVKQLKEIGLKTVGVSLDGLKENHEWLRRTPGSYDTAISGIKHLVSAGIGSVMVTTMVFPRNIHELRDIYNLVNSLGCNTWRPIGIDPIGRALDAIDKTENINSLYLNPEQIKLLLDLIVELRNKYYDELKAGKHITKTSYTCNYYLGFNDGYEGKVRDWLYRCVSGINVCSIGYNGDILGCLDIPRDDRLVQGNIRKSRIYEIWIHKFKQFRENKAYKNEKCSNCSERDICRGGGYHTWDLETENQKVCLVEKLMNL